VKLPLLLSVPHAGLRVPPEVVEYCILTEEQIAEDGDEVAAEIYDLKEEVAALLTTDVARAVVDMNRAENDRRADGVVKTHTCWDVPVYGGFPSEDVVKLLIARYHRPYHTRLSELARSEVRLGVDCHTMAAKGPPVGPDPGIERPWVCLSNADKTCKPEWIESLASCFERAFQHNISINVPFRGGYIIQSHAAEMPWVQLELSRAAFMTNREKRSCVLTALRTWSDGFLPR